ncbi:hypothetical protein AHAS_Ahas15G0345300 [Arachis hypogaea]
MTTWMELECDKLIMATITRTTLTCKEVRVWKNNATNKVGREAGAAVRGQQRKKLCSDDDDCCGRDQRR